MNKHLFIQKGFVKSLTLADAKRSMVKMFDLERWFKETCNKFNISYSDPCCPTETDANDNITAAGEISTTGYLTKVTSTAAYAATLPDGGEGQKKLLFFEADGGDVTITPDNFANGTTITLGDSGDMIELVFLNGKWRVVTNSGATVA